MCSTHSMNSEKSSKRRKVEYHCEYCDKSYKKSAKLVEHVRSHTGEVSTFHCFDTVFQ